MINREMFLRLALMSLALALCFGAVALSQSSKYPMVDEVAANVVAHYENSSCEKLWEEKMDGPSAEKQQKIETATKMMRDNPEVRKYFIDKIASPLVNKMFECGMIP